MIITTNGPQNIGQIKTHFELENLFLSPEEYQRVNAWNLDQKKLLIDTIFQGMDIPKLYFWKIGLNTIMDGYPDGETKNYYKDKLLKKQDLNDDLNPYLFEVVDGQQRIRTILEYMGIQPPNSMVYRGTWQKPYNALEETPMAKGRKYSELNVEQRIKFEEQPLTVMIIESANIYEIRDMFLRLQNGTPLNAQQKRDAMGSNIGKAARELSKYGFFTTSVKFGNKSAAYHLVASQMLHLEIKGKIISCTSRQLDKLYERYRKIPVEPRILKKCKNVLSVLGNIFDTKNQHLNRSYALSLYWAISQIIDTYNLKASDYPKIRENFENLDQERLEAMQRDYSDEPNDEIYFDLSKSMSYGTDGRDAISIRNDIIVQRIFDDISLEPHLELDPKRNFTEAEKLIIYRRANGKCQLECNGVFCGKEIEFDESVVDHIVPHSKGGETTLENGRIAYQSCNISRGNRDDFDPSTMCKLLN